MLGKAEMRIGGFSATESLGGRKKLRKNRTVSGRTKIRPPSPQIQSPRSAGWEAAGYPSESASGKRVAKRLTAKRRGDSLSEGTV